jgi:hypothetical protein
MMPPTSIDGTDITGATIDGTDVTEITVDGQTVFTADALPGIYKHDWIMNEGSGTTVSDEIGNSDLTINGATWISDANKTGGTILDFDGNDDFASVSSLDNMTSTTEATFVAWLELDSIAGGDDRLFSDDNFDNILLNIFSNKFDLRFGSNSGDSPSASLPTNQFLMLTWVQDGNNATIYFDNANQQATKSYGIGTFDPNQTFSVGNTPGDAVNAINGKIDRVLVADTAATAQQVSDTYGATDVY